MFDSYISLSGYTFHRPFYERQGYNWIKKDGKIIFLFNTLGIDKKDISVATKPTSNPNFEILTVKGKTDYEDFESAMDVEFSVIVPVGDGILYQVKDGFTRVEITLKEPAKSETKIEMVD